MYWRPKFLETLIKIRETMAAEADYDVDLLAEMVRSGRKLVKREREAGTASNTPVHPNVRARVKT